MLPIAELVIEDFKSKDFVYDVKEASDGDVILRFPYDGKAVTMIFTGDRGEYVSFYHQIERVPEDKMLPALLAANSLNDTYKWLKFYIDHDNDLMAQDDAILTEENAAEETLELLARGLDIVKDAKPVLMKALYA